MNEFYRDTDVIQFEFFKSAIKKHEFPWLGNANLDKEDYELFRKYFDNKLSLCDMVCSCIGVTVDKEGDDWYSIPQTGFCCFVKRSEIYHE